MQTATALSIYEELGVKPVINARGHNTVLGGSTPSPRVKAAMEQAERYYVEMQSLLEKSGEIIARLLECEAAYVTPGAAAAMTLGTAAFITGSDLEKMSRLPDTTGMKNKVLIQSKHHYSYERATTIVGTKLVDVGDAGGTTRAQLEAALDDKVVTLLYPAHLEGTAGTLSLKEVLEICHARDVPVLVDAAGQVLPLEKFRGYGKMGCDLVTFGAKYFGALNATGILAGKKKYVDAAVPQGFIGFETVTNRKGFGRPLKLDRQSIVATVVALQEWMEVDHPRRLARLEQRCRGYHRGLENAPGLSFSVVEYHASAPRVLRIDIDATKAKRSAADIEAGLRDGMPMILVNRHPGYHVGAGPASADALFINPNTVDERDDEVIAQRLRALVV